MQSSIDIPYSPRIDSEPHIVNNEGENNYLNFDDVNDNET